MDTWKEINAQCAQYFSISLMQELTGHLTEVQQRRLLMLANGLSMREIAICEGIKHHAGMESIEGGKMDEL